MTLKNAMGLVIYECPICGIINKKERNGTSSEKTPPRCENA